MNTSPSIRQNIVKLGLCPHGLIQASCPICSKQTMSMGMGVGKLQKKSNEWSYQKCYAVGLEIRAAKQRRENTENFWKNRLQNSLTYNKNIQNFLDKFTNLIQNFNLQKNITSVVYNSIVIPFIQKASDLTSFVTEKIVNIFGEIKNFNARKLVDNIFQKAKKIMLLCLYTIGYENYKNDETLAIYKSSEIKKYIKNFLTKRKHNGNRGNTRKSRKEL